MNAIYTYIPRNLSPLDNYLVRKKKKRKQFSSRSQRTGNLTTKIGTASITFSFPLKSRGRGERMYVRNSGGLKDREQGRIVRGGTASPILINYTRVLRLVYIQIRLRITSVISW